MASAYVQGKATSSATNISNLTVTPAAGFTAGNCVVVGIGYQAGGALTVSSVQNQSGTALTYSQVGTGPNIGGYGSFAIVIPNIIAGVTAIKVTLSGSAFGGMALTAAEFSGIATTSPVDATTGWVQQSTGSTSADAITSGALTASAAGMLVGINWMSNNSHTAAAGTGFSSDANLVFFQSIVGGRLEYKNISAGSAAATWTDASNGGDTCQNIAFNLLDAGGGGGGGGTSHVGLLTLGVG